MEDKDFNKIKGNLGDIANDLNKKMKDAQKLGDALQSIIKDSKPLEEKNCTINGWNCVIQRYETRVAILFPSSVQAKEFYQEKNVNLLRKLIRFFK